MSEKLALGLKRRRRTRLLIRASVFLLALILFLGGILAIAESSFAIKEVSAKGASRINEKDLIAASKEYLEQEKFVFLTQANAFFFDSDFLAEELKKRFAPIEEISTERDFFQRGLQIVITERKAWAVWCQNACFYLDNQGVLFQAAPRLFGGLILKIADERPGDFQSGDQILNGEFFNLFKNFVEEIAKVQGITVLNVRITSDNSFWLETAAGWQILLDSETDFSRAKENLKLFADSAALKEKMGTLDYIDLRFSDKGFYKFR